jgi:hypothetical protein
MVFICKRQMVQYRMTCLDIYLPWYSGTYNFKFQGVEYLQLRFRGPVTVTSPLIDHDHRRLHL